MFMFSLVIWGEIDLSRLINGRQKHHTLSFKFFCCVKFQAFLELATEEAAITMVNYYSAVTPHLRNQPIFIQYSNHKELKTDNTLNQVSMFC